MWLVRPVKSSALPPGNICGHPCPTSPSARLVTGVGIPPFDETRSRPPRSMPAKNGAYTIDPSEAHQPPLPSGVSQIVTGAPPDNATFFSLASAKNAIH